MLALASLQLSTRPNHPPNPPPTGPSPINLIHDITAVKKLPQNPGAIKQLLELALKY